MVVKASIDKAGRLVLPKPLRDKLRLAPGDGVLLESEGEQITLRPDRPQATLKKKRGIWVYHGSRTDISLSELIDHEREKRSREIAG